MGNSIYGLVVVSSISLKSLFTADSIVRLDLTEKYRAEIVGYDNATRYNYSVGNSGLRFFYICLRNPRARCSCESVPIHSLLISQILAICVKCFLTLLFL